MTDISNLYKYSNNNKRYYTLKYYKQNNDYKGGVYKRLDFNKIKSDDYETIFQKLHQQHYQVILKINIRDFNEELTSKLNTWKIHGLKIKGTLKDINLISNFLENINDNIVIYSMSWASLVNGNLVKRKTFQGFNKSILNEVRKEIKDLVLDNDVVVDATVGKGYDTLFLASLTPLGKVYGFDIQKSAITETKERTKDYPNVKLYLKSHALMDEEIDEKVKMVIFNLGYLPGGDKKITTTVKTTIIAIQKAYNLLLEGGKIFICIYPGHDEGNKEDIAIREFVEKSKFNYYIKRNTDNKIAPYLLVIEK